MRHDGNFFGHCYKKIRKRKTPCKLVGQKEKITLKLSKGAAAGAANFQCNRSCTKWACNKPGLQKRHLGKDVVTPTAAAQVNRPDVSLSFYGYGPGDVVAKGDSATKWPRRETCAHKLNSYLGPCESGLITFSLTCLLISCHFHSFRFTYKKFKQETFRA